MNIFIPPPLPDHARNLLRRLGYGEAVGHGGQTSFARRAGGAPYPRFHAYVEDRDGGVQINLHLDQKLASYEGAHAHSGEYDGPLVIQEIERIKSQITSWQSPPAQNQSQDPSSPKGFWGNLFS